MHHVHLDHKIGRCVDLDIVKQGLMWIHLPFSDLHSKASSDHYNKVVCYWLSQVIYRVWL
jgi:hypothetical protein